MRTTVTTSEAPTAIGPYSQAIRFQGLLFCSGQLGLKPNTGDFISNDTVKQTEQALRNLDAVCREAGTSLQKALRLTIFMTDLSEFQAVNQVYATFFESPFPARVTVQVSALPKGGRIEIDAIVAL
jgi:2-iminobutanoate/2-iminopropanoate deaminase